MPTERPLFGEVWTTLTPTGVNIHAVIANPSMTDGPSYATGNVIVLVTTTGQRIRLPPHGISGWAFEAPAYLSHTHQACSATSCRRSPRFQVENGVYCPVHLPKGVQATILSEENDSAPRSWASAPTRLGMCAFCSWEDIEATPLQASLQDFLGFQSFRPEHHFSYSCPRCQAIYITAETTIPREDLVILRGASATGTTTIVCSLTGVVNASTDNLPLTRREGIPEHLMLLVSRMPRQVEVLPQAEVPLPQIPAIGSQWVNRIDRSIVFIDRFSSPDNPRAGAIHFRTSEPGTLAPMPFHDFLSYFSPLQERRPTTQVEIPCKPGEEWENRVGVYADLYKIIETNAALGTVIVEDAAGQRRSIRAAEMARGWEKIVRVSVFDRLAGEDFI